MPRLLLWAISVSLFLFWLFISAVILFSRILPTKQLIYTTDFSGRSNLILLDFYHRIPVKIMEHVFDPSWSPDGERIVFYLSGDSSISGLYILDVFNHHLQLLNKNGLYFSSASWSPDGREIAFVNGGISLMPINCSDAIDTCATQLTPNDGKLYSTPTWSPDGKHIAFVSTKDTVNNNENIFVMNRDGSHLRQLTENLGFDREPSWSPDSRHIVYSSHNLASGTTALMMLDTECSAGVSCIQPVIGDNWEMMPDWSRDGHTIVFIGEIGSQFELYITDTKGRYLQRLTYNNTDENSPRWRP